MDIHMENTLPKDIPDWVWGLQSMWTASPGYRWFRDSFTSLDLQTRLTKLLYPKIRLVPYFDPSYRAREHAKFRLNDQDVDCRFAEFSSSTCYKYESLPANAIRLLHLQPGPKDKHICCNITTTSIQNDMPEFEALSYTWGDTTKKKSISCNGSSLVVPANAACALADLRHEQEVRVLWIDAIAVNQEDIEERNAQIQLMRKIYLRASRVPVWLGHGTTDTDRVFAVISRLSTLRKSEDPSLQNVLFARDDLVAQGLPDASDAAWKNLDRLLWSSWFLRVWIIQEIALARVAVATLGSYSCPWTDLELAGRYINDHMLTTLVDVDPSQILRLTEIKSIASHPDTSILQLVGASRSSRSTDPRDKLLGLLGLVPTFTQIIPDYHMSTEELYVLFTIKMIETRKSLDILNYIEHWGDYSLSPNDIDSTPSWAVNWVLSGLTKLLPSTAELEAGTLHFDHNPGSRLLKLKGLELGIIENSGNTFLEWIPRPGNAVRGGRSSTERVRPLLVEQLQSVRWRQWDRLARRKTYPTGEDVREAYARTLVANARLEGVSEGTSLAACYDSWVRFWRITSQQRGKYMEAYITNTAAQEREHAAAFMEAYQAAAYGRRFFVTRTGYFGLGPFKVHKGDKVVAFSGGKTAYVIRWRARVDGQVHWKILGEAYIHGVTPDVIMQRRSDLETFILR